MHLSMAIALVCWRTLQTRNMRTGFSAEYSGAGAVVLVSGLLALAFTALAQHELDHAFELEPGRLAWSVAAVVLA